MKQFCLKPRKISESQEIVWFNLKLKHQTQEPSWALFEYWQLEFIEILVLEKWLLAPFPWMDPGSCPNNRIYRGYFSYLICILDDNSRHKSRGFRYWKTNGDGVYHLDFTISTVPPAWPLAFRIRDFLLLLWLYHGSNADKNYRDISVGWLQPGELVVVCVIRNSDF